MPAKGARTRADRCALVTGGAQGIGFGIAQALAREGYRVVVADLDAEAGREAARTPGLAFVRCDVSRESSVRACVRAALRRFGRLDALVNNAGLAGPADPPVERLALAQWNRRLAVNLTGALLMAKHCARGAILRRTTRSIRWGASDAPRTSPRWSPTCSRTWPGS